jgi:putative transposase
MCPCLQHQYADNTGDVNDRNDEIRGYKTYRKRRSLRLPGFEYRLPCAYHLTWGTFNRKPMLNDSDIAVLVIKQLERQSREEEMLLYAYCVMPDHIHLLIAAGGNHNVVSFVQAYKSKTTRMYWTTKNQGKLWQHGFYDRILREEQDIKQVSRYILENPVRKGIVDDFMSYPFSGSLVFKKEDL